jgi:hypothetical protein
MIHLTLPGLPPSVNAIYMTVMKAVPGKRPMPIRVLTTEGQKYKKEMSAHLAQKFPSELAKFKPNKPYLVMFRLHVPDLLTKTWPAKAKSRYKKLDATNRTKILEDVLADVAAVDDANNIAFLVHKVDAPAEKTEIWAWSMEEERSPFCDALDAL